MQVMCVENEYEVDAGDLDRELVASRLRNDTLESKGKIFRRVADQVCRASNL